MDLEEAEHHNQEQEDNTVVGVAVVDVVAVVVELELKKRVNSESTVQDIPAVDDYPFCMPVLDTFSTS